MVTNIRGSVGRGGQNCPGDVRTIQELLNRHRPVFVDPKGYQAYVAEKEQAFRTILERQQAEQ